MDFNDALSAISTVGFPIFACCFLFKQNNELTKTINSLKETLVEQTTILKMLSSHIKEKKEDNE